MIKLSYLYIDDVCLMNRRELCTQFEKFHNLIPLTNTFGGKEDDGYPGGQYKRATTNHHEWEGLRWKIEEAFPWMISVFIESSRKNHLHNGYINLYCSLPDTSKMPRMTLHSDAWSLYDSRSVFDCCGTKENKKEFRIAYYLNFDVNSCKCLMDVTFLASDKVITMTKINSRDPFRH